MASKQLTKKPVAATKAGQAKPATKGTAKAQVRTSPKSAPVTPVKPAVKPAAKAAVKPAAKAAVKPAVKPAAKPVPSTAASKVAAGIPHVVGIKAGPSIKAASSAPVAAAGQEAAPEALPELEVPHGVAQDLPLVIGKAAAAGALTLSVQTSQGNAANGNTQPANILVLVSDRGAPVVDLTKDHFTLMEHFEVPGQMAPFSNNISSFRNAGTGAYLLQTKPITGAAWRSGHHLAQLLVSDDQERQGQIAFKLIIR